MGIQFTALDSRELRETPFGVFPARVVMPAQFDGFGFNMGNAFAVFDVLNAAMTFKGHCKGLQFNDRQYGRLTVFEFRRALMAARTRFDQIVDRSIQLACETFSFEDERIHDLSSFDREGLREKIELLSRFVEVASQRGADEISWG